LLKTKNSNYNTNIFNINSNSNSNSVSFNKRKVPFPKNENNYYFNKYDKYEINMQDNNNSRDSIRRLKDLLITNNKNDKNRVISYSPSSNNNFRNANYQYINQSPIKKTSENNLKNNGNDVQSLKEHKIRNVLSKNLTYNKKTPNSTKTSPLVSMGSGQQKGVYLARLKNSSDSNNNCIINMDYGSKTYVGRDNYSVSSFQNKNTNSPKTPSYMTDIDSYNSKNNKSNNYNNSNILQNNYFIEIKLEELIMFDERLNDIDIAINHPPDDNKSDIGALNECFEFFSFYFHSSLKYKFPLFFQEQNRIIIQSSINLKIFIIMITYHLSMNPSMITKLLNDLKYIFSQLKQNLYLFIKKLYIFYGEAFIMQNEMYFKTFNYFLQRNGLNNLNENEIKNIINQNCCNIVKNISIILNYYKAVGNPFYLDFYEIFSILSKLTEKEINNYFCTYLIGLKKPKNEYVVNNDNHSNKNFNYNLRNKRIENSINTKQILEYQKYKIPAPYITTPTNKKYTLVLDLDNTLISHNNRNRNNNDICNLRPGLLSFLNVMKPLYELISYTNESKEYSEQLLKEIESSRKYFDYNLYKEHNVLIDNNLVKDISKIGRDMKKIIIVDKNYENIKSTPQNGILIKPYFGESSQNDTVLFELKKLLILFHKIGYEDIRVAIKNYESDIKYKITLDNNK